MYFIHGFETVAHIFHQIGGISQASLAARSIVQHVAGMKTEDKTHKGCMLVVRQNKTKKSDNIDYRRTCNQRMVPTNQSGSIDHDISIYSISSFNWKYTYYKISLRRLKQYSINIMNKLEKQLEKNILQYFWQSNTVPLKENLGSLSMRVHS